MLVDRLEARRVFNYLDLDQSGLLDATEVKKALRRLGMIFVTDKQVMKVIREFDINNDGAIDENEFVEYFGNKWDKRATSLMGRLMNAVLFMPPNRVSVLRSQRFVAKFRCVCDGGQGHARVVPSASLSPRHVPSARCLSHMLLLSADNRARTWA